MADRHNKHQNVTEAIVKPAESDNFSQADGTEQHEHADTERQTWKNYHDVRRVKDELKKERAFNNFNGWLSIVTFALVILVIIGEFIYESSSNARNKTRLYDMRSNIGRLEERVQGLRESDNVTNMSMQNLASHQQESDERMSQLERQQASESAKMAQAIARFEEMAKPLAPTRVAADPETLLANEAAYLMRIAFRKMYLERDPATAIALLKDADAALAEIGDPSLLKVRRAIGADLAALRELEIIDTEGIALRLSSLSSNVLSLKTKSYKDNFRAEGPLPEDEIKEHTVTADASDWKENLSNSFGNFLDGLVVVRKKEGADREFLTRDEEAILRDKVALLLMQAQLAVYSQQQPVFEVSLDKATALIARYFDTEDVLVAQALRDLADIRTLGVAYVPLKKFECSALMLEYMKSGKTSGASKE